MAYSNAIFYLDYENGSDAARTTISDIVFSNPSEDIVLGTKVGHGLVTGAVITISGCTQAYANSTWKVTRIDDDTFTLDSASWSSFNGADVTGNAVPFGGSSWADAWKTITSSGVSASRVAPGDTVRVAKSPDPVSLGTTGAWTCCPNTLPSAVSITSSTNASPIQINKTGHGLVTGDIIYIQDHTTNLTANGTWIVTRVDDNSFTLDGSVGVGAGASGTFTKIPWHCVVLGASSVQTITRCEQAWVAANSATVTLDVTQYKEGDASMKCVKASPANSTLYAYFATGTLDLSGYQKLSFWIYNATAITANQWSIYLCSDTAGATVVDTIAIPAIPSVNKWVCLTLVGDNANFGSAIQSIALYSGSSAGSTSGIYLDNIIACTTDGLNLQSLISKNSAAHGGTEPFFAIQSISEDGTVVRLDNTPTTLASANLTTRGGGYSGVTETVTTYKRETIKTDLVASNLNIIDVQDSGTDGDLISYEGGYNTSSSLQDGETYFDGLNGFGIGLYQTNKSYFSFNYFSFYRYGSGISFTGGHHITLNNIGNINSNLGWAFTTSGSYAVTLNNLISCSNNAAYGIIWAYGSYNFTVGTISHCSNNTGTGFALFSGVYNITVEALSYANNNTANGIMFSASTTNRFELISNACFNAQGINSTSHGNWFDEITNIKYNTNGIYAPAVDSNYFGLISNCNYNTSSGLYFAGGNKNTFRSVSLVGNGGNTIYLTSGSNNRFYNVTTSGNTGYIFTVTRGTNYVRNAVIAEASIVTGAEAYADCRLCFEKLNGTAGNNYIYSDSGYITSVATDRSGGTGIMWKMFITAAARNAVYPLTLSIAKIAVVANKLVMVKAWVKKDHATNVKAKLNCPCGQLSGLTTDTSAVKANDTDWEELTVTFTPTEAGVVEIEVSAEYVAGNSQVYVEDMTITQES